MRRIAVCDAETDPFKRERVPAPFLWGFYDGSQYQEFTTTAAFVEFLEAEDCICYAHNGGRFDWHFLLPYIEAYEEISLINGRIARFRLGQAECRDSYNLLPVPLAAYKKDDIDYSIMERAARAKPENARKIAAYLKSDCIYLWELITQFVERYGLQITQASASMKQWRKISNQEIPRTDKAFYREWSDYYYGGRVQCFQSGVIDTDFIVGDINSAYPRAMLEKHPYSSNASIVKGYKAKADFYRLRAESTGAFPYKGDGGGLSFPSDGEIREFTVTGWEVQAARDTGTLKRAKFLESSTFINHVDFSDYVNFFYAERQRCKVAGDEAGSLFAKLFMNSGGAPSGKLEGAPPDSGALRQVCGEPGALPRLYDCADGRDMRSRDAGDGSRGLEFRGGIRAVGAGGTPDQRRKGALLQRGDRGEHYGVCAGDALEGNMRGRWHSILRYRQRSSGIPGC